MSAALLFSVFAVAMATATVASSDDVWLKIKSCENPIDDCSINCTNYVLKHSEACFKPKGAFSAVPFRCEKRKGVKAVWFEGHRCITNASSASTQYYCDSCREEIPELTLCNMTNRSMTRYNCDTCNNKTDHSGCTPMYTVGFDTCSYVQGLLNGEGSLLVSEVTTLYRILFSFGQFGGCFANSSTQWTQSMPAGACDWSDGTVNIAIDCIPAANDEPQAARIGVADTVHVDSIDEIPAKVMMNIMKRFSLKHGA